MTQTSTPLPARRGAGISTGARIAARLRMPAMMGAAALFIAGIVTDAGEVSLAGLALLVVAFALYFRLGTPRAEPTVVRAPVTGRWSAINSPADKVPSHGLHAYGQTYAIDFVHVPEGTYEIDLGWSPVTRAPEEFPGFGRPVVAPADGTVVRVRDRGRDHRSRSSWPALALFFAEAALRELAGPGRLMGNHVVMEIRPGIHAVVAHLQRGSITVRPGDRVHAGQEIGACGNSGSSSEPHVHFQLMDHPRPLLAAGLPFTLAGATDDEGETVALPATGGVVVG
jgi:hypothetical protein